MEDNEHRSEQKPTSAMVRDATRLRAVMGGGDSTMRAASSPPFPQESDVPAEDRRETRLRFGAVADTPPSTLPAVTAAPESSATRIAPPTAERIVQETSGNTSPGSADTPVPTPIAHDDTPTAVPRQTPRAVVEPLSMRTANAAPRTETYAPRRRRGSGFIAFTAIGLGLLIGVAVWAGVGSDIAALFSGSESEPIEANPALVTETPPALTPTEQSTPPMDQLNGQTQPVEAVVIERESAPDEVEAEQANRRRDGAASENVTTEARHQSRVEEASQQSSQHSTRQQTTTAPAREAQRAGQDEAQDEPTVRAATTPSATTRDEGATSGGGSTARYSVQVRSTTDRREAEGIAERLRDRGVRNVRVETLKKDGVDMFRVRYGRYDSSNEAKGEADKLGHSDVWIVRDRSNP